MNRGEPWQGWAAGAVVFALAYLSVTAAGSFWGFPHVYAGVSTDFDTSFMVLADGDPAPLDIVPVSSRNETQGGTELLVDEVTFFSHRHDGVDIRIFAAIVGPATAAGPLPGLVVVHGYGGTHASMMEVARDLAASGHVAIAIDAPDSGGSTPYPRRTPENLVNATPDPRGGFFYHVAYAASRALSVLETLPTVDGSRLGATGASQGGVVSLYLAAKDPRVRASVPIIPGGNLEEVFWAPSFGHALVPRGAGPTDPRLLAFRRHYDPLGYAPLIPAPVLFLAGTHDEFFPLPGVMATYEAIPSRKWLGLVPNHGHAGYGGWTETAGDFFAWAFAGGPPLPDPSILGVTSDIAGINVSASATAASDLLVLYRGPTAGEAWRSARMAPSGGVYRATVSPTWPGKASVFVAIVEGGRYVTATPVVTVESYALVGPVAIGATLAMSVYLLGLAGTSWRDRVLPLGAALLSWLGASVAWIGVPGRAAWGWYEIADRTSLGPVLIAPFALWFAGMVAVALVRPARLPALAWVPVVFSGIVYGILFAVFGGDVALAPSWGFAAVLAAPIVLLAGRWRARAAGSCVSKPF